MLLQLPNIHLFRIFWTTRDIARLNIHIDQLFIKIDDISFTAAAGKLMHRPAAKFPAGPFLPLCFICKNNPRQTAIVIFRNTDLFHDRAFHRMSIKQPLEIAVFILWQIYILFNIWPIFGNIFQLNDGVLFQKRRFWHYRLIKKNRQQADQQTKYQRNHHQPIERNPSGPKRGDLVFTGKPAERSQGS